MGTGVGEAMLMSAASGAAMGAGSAALTGGDPLRGALTGGLFGGAATGLGGALGGQAATAGQAAAQLPSAAAPTALQGTLGEIPGASFGEMMPLTPMPPSVPEVGLWDVFSPGGKSELSGMGLGERAGNYLVQNPIQAGMGAGSLGSMMGGVGKKALGGDDDDYDGPLSFFKYDPEKFRPSFAQGGIAELPTMFDGRMVEGPGDGMSDDIPAMIEGEQEAALADGEFVIPADVVSGLGNGSTDAGAQWLYDFISRIRQARTGTPEQGQEINPDAFV